MLAASQDTPERHSQWDVEHVFLALLQYPGGVAQQIFAKLNVDIERVRQRVADTLDRSPKLAYDVVREIYTTPGSSACWRRQTPRPTASRMTTSA